MTFCQTQDKKADAEWTEFVPLCKEGLFFFQYSSGHAWSRMEYYSIYPVETGAMLQYQWIPSGMNENEAPIIRQVVLTEEEFDAFSDLLGGKLRLTKWDGFYYPKLEVTDQSYWRTCLLYNGEWYYSGGYDFFPKELSLFSKRANSYLAN